MNPSDRMKLGRQSVIAITSMIQYPRAEGHATAFEGSERYAEPAE
ncbi:hypothetical protein [Streptomyces sp. NPDC002491]